MEILLKFWPIAAVLGWLLLVWLGARRLLRVPEIHRYVEPAIHHRMGTSDPKESGTNWEQEKENRHSGYLEWRFS